MRSVLGRVWWIGGSPCSGKSTQAALLALRLGALHYTCDDVFDRHAAAVSADQGPTLKEVTSMSVNERLAQPLSVQVDDVVRVYREEWPQILDDLNATPGRIVAEGAALLPELLTALGVPADRAAWIVPTESFQRAQYARRHWAQELVSRTADPATAFETWMQRDVKFATIITAQASEVGYRLLITTDQQPIAAQKAELDAILGTS